MADRSLVVQFDLDDVDRAFSRVRIVKFNQTIRVEVGSGQVVTLCAYPSGRTIGGSTWCICHGSTEVLYVMDVNLKKETVLDGADLLRFPQSPAVLIVDSGGSLTTSLKTTSSSISSSSGSSALQKRKRGDRDDPAGLIAAVMETVRGDGNALVPCETAGRALEIMQVLALHWAVNKLGMYHLVFLSPMAHNVLEFSRSLLEWMSASISRTFYLGKSNPFDLLQLKVCTSVRELEKLYPGPKVVLATDSSLTCGCAKDLLLRWGGDPRCRVIFTDVSTPNTLAAELRTQTPPILATVTKPVRVELAGDELAQYRSEIDKKKRATEEAALRQRREDELELVGVIFLILFV